LFGIITNDAEKSVTEAGLEDFNSDNKTFKVMGATKIVGGIAGGVTGYSGIGIHLQDVQYVFKNTEAEQSIIAYDGGYAGGVVGLLDGLLNQARSEYVVNDKEELNDVFAYYNSVGELKKYKNIFYQADYSPKYIGGLVGYVRNKGEILRAYSKLNVINPNAEYVGGLVGYADTLKLTEAYATGDVSGENYVGGLAGGVKNNLNLDNVNALNVWSKDLNSRISQMKGFGALVGEKINNIVDSQFVKVNAVGKVSGSDNIPLVSNTDTNTKEKAAKNIDQTFTYVAENKQEIIDSSEYVFKITERNFNPDKWEKDDNDLYLDMRFIVRNNVLYINEAEDLKLIKKYPTATFIITDMIDCRVFSINNKNFQIEYFAGVLKGKDVDKEYGFQNLELNNPLFNRVVNASFNNFTMKLTTDTTVDTNAVLVNYAKGIETDLLTFKNYKLNVSNEYSSVALVVANVESGNSSLNGLKLIGNEINITANNSKDLYAGLVFGRSEGSTTLERLNIVNNVNEPSKTSNIIEIKSTEVKPIQTFAAVENSSNIYAGLVGGKSSSISIINKADIEAENIISGKLTVEGAENAYV
ncbi:MAG: hypothetical protein IKA31_05120, partial [Clostridia bacterium]|nr:hypothetical protein [Clostridia bacterium]